MCSRTIFETNGLLKTYIRALKQRPPGDPYTVIALIIDSLSNCSRRHIRALRHQYRRDSIWCQFFQRSNDRLLVDLQLQVVLWRLVTRRLFRSQVS